LFVIPMTASPIALLQVYNCDTLSTSCNPTERNLMGLSQENKWAKPPVHLCLSIFHDLHQKTVLLICQNAEVLRHVIATFSSMLQEQHLLNTAVIHFPENSCYMQLLNFPR
jgi:hypothetical protein